MNDFARSTVMLLFFLGIIYEFFISVNGILAILSFNKQEIPIILSITAITISFIISGLTLNTVNIWEEQADNVHIQLRVFNIIGVIFSIYTSFVGTGYHVIAQKYNSTLLSINFTVIWAETTFMQKSIILLMTLFSAMSPVLFSIIFLDKNKNTK